MSLEAQLTAWVTLMQPAFTALLVIAAAASVTIVIDDIRTKGDV